MVDCYAYKSEFGAMFARVVTVLRFEIPGAIGELEITNLLTEGNGDHREEPEPRNRSAVFSPPMDWELRRTSVQACQTNIYRGFCVLRSVTGVYLSRLQKWVLGNVYRGCHAVTL